MKIVGIIQPNYLPWRGYFDFINVVDTFIFLDDVQYTRRDWRNRNQIKTKDGLVWLTVPVDDIFGKSLIYETPIKYNSDWPKAHLRLLKEAYGKSQFWDDFHSKLQELLNIHYKSIAELDIALCKWICHELNIKSEFLRSSSLASSGHKDAKLIQLIKAVGGTHYLTGPSGLNYMNLDSYHELDISVLIKTYNYPPYPQDCEDFVNSVSILDLLFNCGPNSREYIISSPSYVKL